MILKSNIIFIPVFVSCLLLVCGGLKINCQPESVSRQSVEQTAEYVYEYNRYHQRLGISLALDAHKVILYSIRVIKGGFPTF